jgi:hypothetical protein
MTYLRKWQLQQLKPLLQCSKLVAGFPAGSWQSHSNSVTTLRLVLLLGGGPIAQTDSLQSPRSDILPALKRLSLKSRSGIYLCGYPRRSKK